MFCLHPLDALRLLSPAEGRRARVAPDTVASIQVGSRPKSCDGSRRYRSQRKRAPTRSIPGTPSTQKAVYKTLSPSLVKGLEGSTAGFEIKFTEDAHGFYVNDRKYSPTDGPMLTVKVGHYVSIGGCQRLSRNPPVSCPPGTFSCLPKRTGRRRLSLNGGHSERRAEGSVDLIMDFTDPIIRGMSVFHCHLLKHEDKGMMAKILFQ